MIREWLDRRQGDAVLEHDAADVIIHIGAPKSGTSAIQRFCSNHRAELERAGLFYPEHPVDPNGVSGGHSQMAAPLIKGDLEVAQRRLQSWLNEARKRGLVLLLSAEGFYKKHNELSEMTHGLNVRIVGLLRNPVDALVANHGQGVKRHNWVSRLSDQVELKLRQSVSHLVGQPLCAWADHFGEANCRFVAYCSPAREVEPIEVTFLTLLGLPSRSAARMVANTEIVNRSYVPSALELKRLLNTVLPELPAEVSRAMDWSLQKYSDRSPEKALAGLDAVKSDARQALIDRLSAELEPVVERFPDLEPVRQSLRSEHKGKPTPPIRVDPSAPLQQLRQDCPDQVEAVVAKAREMLTGKPQHYAFFRLVEVLGIDFQEPCFPRFGLNDAARRVLDDEGSEAADYLREWALSLERAGLLQEAAVVIDKALEKRPQGKGIKQIHQRIHEKRALWA